AVVARYNTDGSPDLTFGDGGSAVYPYSWWYNTSPATALALQGDGKVVLVSNANYWEDNSYHSGAGVARYQADSDIRPQRFGSEEAFRQHLIDQAVQQYSYLLGHTYQNYYYATAGVVA